MAAAWTTTYSPFKPLKFAREILGIEYVTPQQTDVLRDVRDAVTGEGPPFLVYPAGHGIGKSWVCALIAIAFGAIFDRALILTTAPTWTQVRDVLWDEIRHMANRARMPGEWLLTEYRLGESRGIGISTDDPQRFHGRHRGRMLIIIDEGPGVADAIWRVIEAGIAISDDCVIIAIGNPLEASGAFYKAYKEGLKTNGVWKSRTLTCLDHPNWIENKNIVPGATSREKVKRFIENCEIVEDGGELAHLERMREKMLLENPPRNVNAHQVGEAVFLDGVFYKPSAFVQSRVLGVFPDEGDDTLCPLKWVEAAMVRGADVLRRMKLFRSGEYGPEMVPEWDPGKECVVAMDPARFGPDSSVIGVRRGRVVFPLEEYRKSKTTVSAGRLIAAVKKHGASYAAVDNGTFGASIGEMVEETGVDVYPIDFQGKPGNSKQEQYLFENKRAQMYWDFRCKLENDEIDLPDDDDLREQLTSIRYTFTKQGKLVIEPKSDVKKRTGHSPDRADCLVMLCDESLGSWDEEDFEDIEIETTCETAKVGIW